ncbi:MAG: oxidoreductase [Zoogloea sp.]|nr:oxidoreductase [Zoogloea sp.]
MTGDQLKLRVAAIQDIAPTLRLVRFENADAGPLPPSATGAHLQVVLQAPDKQIRNAYSLISKPGSRDAYEIIVRRVPESRGGSAYIHEQLQTGDLLTTSWPGNLFAPQRSARKHIMIAGGIGITPFLSYVADFAGKGIDYELHLCCREEEKDSFAPWLPEPDKVFVHWDADGHRLDIPALLLRQPANTHLYVCGPDFLTDDVLEAAEAGGWPDNHVHCERFGSALSGGEAFRAVLQRSGKQIEVGEHESLLEAIEREGIEVPCLCRGGACGVCLTSVLDGEPQHRDHYLSKTERASGKHIMPCVSRARAGGLLVLDL